MPMLHRNNIFSIHAIIEEAAQSIAPSLDHVLRNAAQVEPWLSGHRSNVGAGAVWLQPS